MPIRHPAPECSPEQGSRRHDAATAKNRRRDERHGALAALAPALVALLTSGAPAKAEAPADVDFTKLSLEELMDVEVTSVSKRRRRVADAAAAIFVITPEDIRRSGATNVPELLRMVPGVEVARIDASKWAVGIRGFNARLSTKLLVLVDGRSVYNPVGQNLLDSRRKETVPELLPLTATQVERAAYGKLTLRF